MKMTKKIILVSMIALMTSGSIFAKGKKDKPIKQGSVVIEGTVEETNDGPTKNTK